MLYTYFQKKLTSYIQKSMNAEQSEMKDKIQALEKEIQSLKQGLASDVKDTLSSQQEPAKIVIEHLSIENVNIDHADLSNNFGNLGIKDLKGQLYIGTTYDKLKPPASIEKELSSPSLDNQMPAPTHHSPKIKVTTRKRS
ncbi:hypothetical protein [Rossellomorea vietnamensis]|uniref:hypothetical protein n=1 Tax=Rossellomorea vietnamensis TaxID=218284 RepID=UPI00308EC876|nr:hypothetical protein Q7C14_10390 [Rossellomorea vietnamensis]